MVENRGILAVPGNLLNTTVPLIGGDSFVFVNKIQDSLVDVSKNGGKSTSKKL